LEDTAELDGSELDEKPLILNSEDDAVTPIKGAEAMERRMGGHLVTVGGGDHGTFRVGNHEVDDVVMTFLETGEVEVNHVDGLESPEPTDIGGPVAEDAPEQAPGPAPETAMQAAAADAQEVFADITRHLPPHPGQAAEDATQEQATQEQSAPQQQSTKQQGEAQQAAAQQQSAPQQGEAQQGEAQQAAAQQQPAQQAAQQGQAQQSTTQQQSAPA